MVTGGTELSTLNSSQAAGYVYPAGLGSGSGQPGGFWLSYFFLAYFIAPHQAPSVAGNAVALYLLGWLIFTAYMTIAALRTNVPVLCVFVTLTATYLLPTLANLGVATSSLRPIGGYVGIACGVAAWYVAFAHVTNASFGRGLIPTMPLS
jgi:uncharacterized protein